MFYGGRNPFQILKSSESRFIFAPLATPYEIHLPQFEGPFDLLLFFIERDELDIYDIPISTITQDFLAYMHHMEELDIEAASEFMLVAATLMRIKAKMLLPRKEIDAQGNEIDPREELVQKLVEYKKFKEVSEELKNLEEDRLRKFKRGNTALDIAAITESKTVEAELHSLSLYNLMHAFNKVLERYGEEKKEVRHSVVRYAYTIEGQKIILTERLSKDTPTVFEVLFADCENRIHAVFNFLALLELVAQQLVDIQLRDGFNNFVVFLLDGEPQADSVSE